jgi:hypothetical protein
MFVTFNPLSYKRPLAQYIQSLRIVNKALSDRYSEVEVAVRRFERVFYYVYTTGVTENPP